ncbi:hypothetical protein P3S67_011363 [Capsicum chacoense]
MLNSNIFVASCSVSLRLLVCDFLAGPPYQTKFKEALVVSNKDIESGTMDESKSQEIESLKEENLRLRQQMIEMYRAWASGMPPPPFPTFEPANTLSLLPKLQSQFPTVVDAPQLASEFIPCQMHLNTSTTLSLAPQYNESTFNTLDDYFYTLDPIVKLSGLPKFLTKNPSMLEELENVVGKVRSVENDMKIPLDLRAIKMFRIKTGACLQPKQSLRGPTHKYCQPQPRAYILDPHNHLQQGFFPQNPRNPIPLPQYPLNNTIVFSSIFLSTMACTCPSTFLFQRLVQQGMITPLLGYAPDLHSRSFDPNVRCAYHSNIQGHSIEDCRALKREIEKMIQDKSIMVQNIDSEESSSHADMQISG